MMILRNLINYFFFPKHRFKPVPKQIINEYDKRKISEDEQLLMMKNKARSPQAAKSLMKRYKADSAAEALEHIPKRKYTGAKERLIKLLQKMGGHDERDPYRTGLVNKDRLDE